MRDLLIPLFILGFATTIDAQIVGGHWSEHMRLDGLNSGDDFGRSMVGIGDVNGDGIDDFAVGIPEGKNGFTRETGAVFAFSGATGARLWDAYGPGSDTYLGQEVALVGDLNGDGIRDVAAGAYLAYAGGIRGAGSVFVYNGKNGNVLLRINGVEENDYLGLAIADAGDINGDGVPDLILGVPNADVAGVFDAGSTWVCSGVDGSIILQFDGDLRRERFGSAVAGCGDIDGDNIPDILCSKPFYEGERGKVYAYSGGTGQLIWEFTGIEQELLGNELAGGQDLDMDGVPDLLLGAMKARVGSEYRAGSVYLRSGATGAIIHKWEGSEGGGIFGSAVGFLEDIDGDHVPDILIGASSETALGERDAGRVHVFSGASGAWLHTIDGPGEYASAGDSVAGLGDLDGDGVSEFGYGAPRNSPNGLNQAGSVYVHGFAPILALESESISASAGESVEALIDFPDSEGGFHYASLVSSTGDSVSIIGGIEVPLTMDAMVQEGLQGNPPNILMNAYGILDANGDASALYLPAPNLPQLVGQIYWGAVVSYDPETGLGRMSSVSRSLEIVP